ncbi:hypothetical protein ACWGLF_37345 [Streptomyces puniciscabiei]
MAVSTAAPQRGAEHPEAGHVHHQVVFIVLSLAGLLLPIRVFFPRVTTTA